MRGLKLVLVLVVLGLALAGSAQSQAPIKNPSGVAFLCVDHALDDSHEVAIVRVSDGVTIQTIAAGDPALTGTEVVVPINVMPVAFGQYRFRVRALAAGAPASDWSEPSEVWERAIGKPTNVVAR